MKGRHILKLAPPNVDSVRTAYNKRELCSYTKRCRFHIILSPNTSYVGIAIGGKQAPT